MTPADHDAAVRLSVHELEAMFERAAEERRASGALRRRLGGKDAVLTIHDMTSFTDPELHEPLRRSRLYRAAIVQSIRLASLVCVPTRAVRDDVLRLVDGVDPGRLRVIQHGISDRFRPEAATSEGERRPARRGRCGPTESVERTAARDW